MVSSTPRPHFTPRKDPVPIVQEAGWAPGPVWTGGKSRPYRDWILDLPARSSVTIPTELPGPHTANTSIIYDNGPGNIHRWCPGNRLLTWNTERNWLQFNFAGNSMQVPSASGENYLHVAIGIRIPGGCFMELLFHRTMDCRFDLPSLHL